MNSVVETVSRLGLSERRRLERDLHDGAQQRLVSLALTLRMAREKLGRRALHSGPAVRIHNASKPPELGTRFWPPGELRLR